MYKIAVYAICKNEEKNIDQWFQSMGEADYICVLDTGSTDHTYDLLREYAKNHPNKVIIKQEVISPWRFDVARNINLAMVPPEADICISTDLDEILTAGGGDKLRNKGYDGCNRAYYLYAWSHLEDGSPARVFWYDKAHDNKGNGKGLFPVHECLDFLGDKANIKDCFLDDNFIMLHHYPSPKLSRSTYLPLLELRVKENPDDYYGYVYLAHEYYYNNMYEKCIDCIENQALNKINNFDLYSCKTDLYMFLGDSYRALQDNSKAEEYYKQGIQEDSTFRENYIKLAHLYLDMGRSQETIEIINECFIKSRRKYSGIETDNSWSGEPGDLLCLAYWNIGAKNVSKNCAAVAAMENPADHRLQENYQIISNLLDNSKED